MEKKNIFDPAESNLLENETFKSLVSGEHLKIEAIYTNKPYTIPGKWYDQEKDEWIVLLQGEASLELSHGSIVHLETGDHLLIPAHSKHRIIKTSSNPGCIWLAVHGNLK